jgi:hypothetical protein
MRVQHAFSGLTHLSVTRNKLHVNRRAPGNNGRTQLVAKRFRPPHDPEPGATNCPDVTPSLCCSFFRFYQVAIGIGDLRSGAENQCSCILTTSSSRYAHPS